MKFDTDNKTGIQDSKNTIGMPKGFVEVDPKIINAVVHENDVEISKGNFVSIDKIEQNQKIVDALIEEYKQLLNVATHYSNKINNEEVISDDWGRKRDNALVKRDHLAKLYHNATGKNIKELL